LSDCRSKVLERDLQALFDQWGNGDAGWRIAGAPQWLAEKRGARNTSNRLAASTAGAEYAFRVDVLWECEPEWVVVELKSSRFHKYEELSLVEVLHHAWCISRQVGKPVVPVVVSSFSVWMRGALAYMREGGVALPNFRYIEATFLERSSDEELRRYAWFEEPLQEWPKEPAPPPSFMSSLPIEWHFEQASTTWIGVQPGTQFCRLVDQPKPVLQVASVEGSDEYLVWLLSNECHDECGRHYLCSPNGAGDSGPDFTPWFS